MSDFVTINGLGLYGESISITVRKDSIKQVNILPSQESLYFPNKPEWCLDVSTVSLTHIEVYFNSKQKAGIAKKVILIELDSDSS